MVSPIGSVVPPAGRVRRDVGSISGDMTQAVGVSPGDRVCSTRAVERAMDLLAQVCDHGGIGLADCARRSQLAPSTALRLLRTLESSGWVTRDDRGLFQAGVRLIQLGVAALGR